MPSLVLQSHILGLSASRITNDDLLSLATIGRVISAKHRKTNCWTHALGRFISEFDYGCSITQLMRRLLQLVDLPWLIGGL